VAKQKRSIAFGLDLPLTLLSSYLFFLSRRPVSSSNRHYLARRLRGLQSLASILEAEGGPELGELARRLHRLTPENFSRLSRELQLELAAAQQTSLTPLSFVVPHGGPSCWPSPTTRRALIIFGPAIGIGDEMILFPLPAAIRAARRDMEIVLMSGYRGLWDRVNVVDQREYYDSHAELIEAISGRSLGPFDAVVFADFEKPGLTPGICVSPKMQTYIEISLGGQCAVSVDTHVRRIHSVSMPIEARANYYEIADWLMEWLGLPACRRDFFGAFASRSGSDESRPFRVFVSPFTSKYEPSLLYWSRLLNRLADITSGRSVEFVLDAGASLSTERFAASLFHAAGQRPGAPVQFRIGTDADSRTLSLRGVFGELKSCDAVICADSFAAHAGPLFGCTTLVMARAGLESWRVPFERSFYFDAAQPIEEVQEAMSRILEQLLEPARQPFALDSEYAALHSATIRLKGLLDAGETSGIAGLDGNYDFFKAAYGAVSQQLREKCACPPGLLADGDYQQVWPGTRSDDGDQQDEEWTRGLRIELGRWENTNLRKYLRLTNR
jgi:hypothetical protein